MAQRFLAELLSHRDQRYHPAMRLGAALPVRHLVASVLAVLIGVSPAFARDGQRQRPPWDAALLTDWLGAVEAHVPGETDGPLLGAAAWSSDELQQLWSDIQILFDLEAHPDHDRFTVSALPYAPLTRHRGVTTFTPLERAAIDLLAARLGRLTASTAIRRGVLLHTDLASLVPDLVRPSAGTSTTGAPLRTRIGDGASAGSESVSLHWEMAHMLLQRVTPEPAADPFVRDWYRATLAASQARQVFDALAQRRALRLLPDDPVIRLLAGCQHEAFASPLFQSFATAWQGRRVTTGIGSTGNELAAAASDFREALARDPGLVEARVRLGYVLGRQGHWAESVAELQRALQGGPEPLLDYYASLFLGTAHQGVGDRPAAVAAWRRAAALTPAARAPHLALARLLREMGDREGSAASLAIGLARPRDDAPVDPWLLYRGIRGQSSAGWLDALRADVRRGRP